MPFWTYFLNNLKAYEQIIMKFLENIKIVIVSVYRQYKCFSFENTLVIHLFPFSVGASGVNLFCVELKDIYCDILAFLVCRLK